MNECVLALAYTCLNSGFVHTLISCNTEATEDRSSSGDLEGPVSRVVFTVQGKTTNYLGGGFMVVALSVCTKLKQEENLNLKEKVRSLLVSVTVFSVFTSCRFSFN